MVKMGARQHFSLRWNNYSGHIVHALDDLRNEDELTDVTLSSEGQKIRAHKLLLSACSTYFRETFRENPCEHPVIIMKGVRFYDLQALVTFMYNGHVNISEDRLSSFLQTAEMLQIKGLTDMTDKADRNEPIVPPVNSIKKRFNNLSSIMGEFRCKTPEIVQPNRPPTPKRKKQVPPPPIPLPNVSQSQQQPESPPPPPIPPPSGTGEDADSPGPSNSNSALMMTDSNSNDEDFSNSAPMLKYDGDNLEGDDEFSNNLSEEGENSLLDMGGMDQGAMEEDELYEDGSIIEEGDNIEMSSFEHDDVEAFNDMPILSPVVQSGLSSGTSPATSLPASKLTASQFMRPRPRPPDAAGANKETPSIGILRRKHRPDSVDDLAFLLDQGIGNASTSARNRNSSPFIGDPVQVPESGELLFPCLMCDKKYKLKSSLESHVKIHEGSENTCSICGQTMSRQRDLKRHVATVHKGLLNLDGTITYPANLEEIFPTKRRSKKLFKTESLLDNVDVDLYEDDSYIIAPELKLTVE